MPRRERAPTGECQNPDPEADQACALFSACMPRGNCSSDTDQGSQPRLGAKGVHQADSKRTTAEHVAHVLRRAFRLPTARSNRHPPVAVSNTATFGHDPHDLRAIKCRPSVENHGAGPFHHRSASHHFNDLGSTHHQLSADTTGTLPRRSDRCEQPCWRKLVPTTPSRCWASPTSARLRAGSPADWAPTRSIPRKLGKIGLSPEPRR
jgi:hypothetical protein